MTNTETAVKLDLDRLEALARATDHDEGEHVYINWCDASNREANLAWHKAASPAAFLALIAQARAQPAVQAPNGIHIAWETHHERT